MSVTRRLSGIVGVVTVTALVSLPMVSGAALAQPDIPLPPTPVYEEPQAPPPAPEAPSVPAPDVPSGPPMDYYPEQQQEIPPPPPLPPAPPAPEQQAPEPEPFDPGVVNEPAPPVWTPEPVPELPTQQAPPPATPDAPVVNPEPSPQAPAQPKPQEPTTEVERIPTQTQTVPAPETEVPPVVGETETPEVAPDQSSETPATESEEPNRPDTTPTEQSSPETSSAPEAAESAVPSTEGKVAEEEPKDPVVPDVVQDPAKSENLTSDADPVVVPESEAIVPKVQQVAQVKEDPSPLPVKQVNASDSSISELAELARSYESSDRDRRGNGHGHGNDDDDDDDDDGHHGPRPHDPDGWECKGNRGPHGCHWNGGWDHDHHGKPIFRNTFKFDLKVVWCDPYTGQFFELTIRAGTYRHVNMPRGRDFGYAVSGVSHAQFALNVAFGTYRGSHCNSHCVPWRHDVNRFDFRLSYGGVWRPGRFDAYDCNCNDRVYYRGHHYDRIWVRGTREVLGTWVRPQNQPRYFVPQHYKETPVSPQYVPGPAPEFRGYGGLGDTPDSATENVAAPPVVDRSLQYALTAASVFLVVGVGGWLLYRHSRRQSES